ncbi:hypothetical protein Tco_1041870 [Tanacetum coccineum]|uniref:Uncharacterized protein n=1 Tax=Tanacetum coccineum TaxID=301880 RepID=A0ABQ5GHZ3_9ASTR
MVEGWMVLELSRREAEEKSNLKTSLARGWYLCLRTFGFPADLASFGLHDVATPALVRILSYHVRWLVLPLNKKCSGFPVSKDPVVLREGGRITTKKYPTKDWYRGDDEVELTDEESSDDMDEVAEWARDTCKPFNYKTRCSEWPTCSWREDSYCNGGNLPDAYHIRNSLHYQDLEWYEALKDCELKDEALRNKAIMEGFIIEDDDESRYEQKRRWNIYTNYDDAYAINHGDNEREELCEVHELPICNVRRYMMIKYSFNNDEEVGTYMLGGPFWISAGLSSFDYDRCTPALVREFYYHHVRCGWYFSFGRHLVELHVTWDHLEKKRTRLQTNTKTFEDLCSQAGDGSQAIHGAVTNLIKDDITYFQTGQPVRLNRRSRDSFLRGVTGLIAILSYICERKKLEVLRKFHLDDSRRNDLTSFRMFPSLLLVVTREKSTYFKANTNILRQNMRSDWQDESFRQFQEKASKKDYHYSNLYHKDVDSHSKLS